MSEIIIVSNLCITVKYLPDKGIIYHTIHKPVSDHPELFKNALTKGTEALKQYEICKWLSDDRKNGPLPQDVLDWAVGGWYKRTIDAGWKYWANVVPEDVVAAGTLIPVIDQLYSMGLRMQIFTTLEAAFIWLDEVTDTETTA